MGRGQKMQKMGRQKMGRLAKNVAKNGTSMILCFYRQDAENFKEKHKIIDVPIC